jgi:hypothetical protein
MNHQAKIKENGRAAKLKGQAEFIVKLCGTAAQAKHA